MGTQDCMDTQEFIYLRTEQRLLQQVFWECTLRCNLNCLHCGSDCRQNDMLSDMPFDDFAKVLDGIAKEKDPSQILIITTGGEPLVRSDIVNCGKEITRRGFMWGMVSNGMLLTKRKLQELIHAGLKTIAISLDGFEADHNWMRGSSHSFKYAVNAIKALSKSSITWDVITCINARNFNRVADFMIFLRSIGVNRWRIFTVFPVGRATENKELQLSDEQFKDLMEFIKTRRNDEFQLSYSCEGYLGEYEMQVRNHPFFCGAGINIASIRCDGAISGCLSIRSKHDQGNIYEDDFMEIWENKFDIFRNRDWLAQDKCKDCEVWNLCRGGAMHLREEHGNMLACSYSRLKKQ